jgi:flavin-dependent dehydrogenase
MSYDALIVGGGPSGSTAALLLARAGWRVALIEKTAFPRRKVCGEFISASSLPLLRELGIAERFMECAGPSVRRVGAFAKDAVMTATMPPAPAGQWGHALGREHLDLLLLDAAARAGTEVMQPAKVTGLRREVGGFVATVTAGNRTREVASRIAIAANGSWEPAPFLRAAVPSHRRSDLLAFKAYFRNASLSPDLMPLLAFPGGYGGMVHSDGGRVTLSCCVRRDRLQQYRQQRPTLNAGEAVLQHIIASCRGVRDALDHATIDGAWLAAGPIRPGLRARYDDGVYLIGNAAGEAHPVVAEGISMALQSAWLLCRELTAGFAPDQAARRYDSAWRAAFAPRIHAAAAFAQIAMRPLAVAAVLPLLRMAPQLLTLGAQLSGKTTLVTTVQKGRHAL